MGKIINFLLGSVRIKITGAFPERFLNLCGTEGLCFWDVKQENGTVLYLTVRSYGLKRARALAQRALCELETVERYGMPSFLYRFRSRYALAAGLVFAIFGAAILSRYILVVEVTGNTALSDSVILTELESLGFGVGSWGPGVDERELSNEMLLQIPELSFLSVNISGVYAEVVVREATEPPEVENRWAAADVVAAADGVILDVSPVVGRVMVEEGQAVLTGEVLISGLETCESGDGSGRVLSSDYVRAEGEVWAMTNRMLRAAIPLKAVKKQPSDKEESVYSLKILKRTMKFPSKCSIDDPTCDKIKHTYAAELPGGTVLPLALEKTTFVENKVSEAEVSRDSAEGSVTKALEQALKQALGEKGSALSTDLSFQEKDGVLIGTLKASCIEQIGKPLPVTKPETDKK